MEIDIYQTLVSGLESTLPTIGFLHFWLLSRNLRRELIFEFSTISIRKSFLPFSLWFWAHPSKPFDRLFALTWKICLQRIQITTLKDSISFEILFMLGYWITVPKTRSILISFLPNYSLILKVKWNIHAVPNYALKSKIWLYIICKCADGNNLIFYINRTDEQWKFMARELNNEWNQININSPHTDIKPFVQFGKHIRYFFFFFDGAFHRPVLDCVRVHLSLYPRIQQAERWKCKAPTLFFSVKKSHWKINRLYKLLADDRW